MFPSNAGRSKIISNLAVLFVDERYGKLNLIEEFKVSKGRRTDPPCINMQNTIFTIIRNFNELYYVFTLT